MNKNEKSKKEALYYYLKIGLAVVFVIWVIFSINGLQGTVQENSNLILRPEFETSFLPGGPERFSEAYADVENANTEENINEDDYLWSTILITNKGKKDATELNINIETVAEMDQILISPSGYGNEVSVETEDNKLSTEINISELDIDDTAYLYVGFNKNKINDNEQNWIDSYENYLQSVSIESGNIEDTFYGMAYN